MIPSISYSHVNTPLPLHQSSIIIIRFSRASFSHPADLIVLGIVWRRIRSTWKSHKNSLLSIVRLFHGSNTRHSYCRVGKFSSSPTRSNEHPTNDNFWRIIELNNEIHGNNYVPIENAGPLSRVQCDCLTGRQIRRICLWSGQNALCARSMEMIVPSLRASDSSEIKHRCGG